MKIDFLAIAWATVIITLWASVIFSGIQFATH